MGNTGKKGFIELRFHRTFLKKMITLLPTFFHYSSHSNIILGKTVEELCKDGTILLKTWKRLLGNLVCWFAAMEKHIIWVSSCGNGSPSFFIERTDTKKLGKINDALRELVWASMEVAFNNEITILAYFAFFLSNVIDRVDIYRNIGFWCFC